MSIFSPFSFNSFRMPQKICVAFRFWLVVGLNRIVSNVYNFSVYFSKMFLLFIICCMFSCILLPTMFVCISICRSSGVPNVWRKQLWLFLTSKCVISFHIFAVGRYIAHLAWLSESTENRNAAAEYCCCCWYICVFLIPVAFLYFVSIHNNSSKNVCILCESHFHRHSALIYRFRRRSASDKNLTNIFRFILCLVYFSFAVFTQIYIA